MSKLDKNTVNYVLTMIKEQLNPKINIMDFYGYDAEKEDKYKLRYKGTNTPSQLDWKLANMYLSIKQNCQYQLRESISFSMELIGE
jgi:hypothetical protein